MLQRLLTKAVVLWTVLRSRNFIFVPFRPRGEYVELHSVVWYRSTARQAMTIGQAVYEDGLEVYTCCDDPVADALVREINLN